MKTFLALLLTCLPLLAQTNLLNTNKTYSVTLAWDANSETNLAGYNVYYGTASGVYTNKTNVGNVTTNRVSGLLKGPRYFFVVTAYNDIGLESDPSNEVSTQTPSAPLIRVQSVFQAATTLNGPWESLTTNVYTAEMKVSQEFIRTLMDIKIEDLLLTP